MLTDLSHGKLNDSQPIPSEGGQQAEYNSLSQVVVVQSTKFPVSAHSIANLDKGTGPVLGAPPFRLEMEVFLKARLFNFFFFIISSVFG
jgi:hypothetical protein